METLALECPVRFLLEGLVASTERRVPLSRVFLQQPAVVGTLWDCCNHAASGCQAQHLGADSAKNLVFC